MEPDTLLHAPTPLIRLPRLAEDFGLAPGRTVWLKYEGAHPVSHTFKDRGAAAAVAAALRQGRKGILAGTCSNMGVAVAGHCAHVGLPAWIVISAHAPRANRYAVARLATASWAVAGGFDEVDALVSELSEGRPDLGCINTNLNDAFRSGFQSLAVELLAQLAPGRAYCVIVPTADGTLLSVLHGWCIDNRAALAQRGIRLRFALAQPAGCMPLVKAWREQTPLAVWMGGDTHVVPLSVKAPLKFGPAALAALRDTGGIAVGVAEEDIPVLAGEFSRATGILADPVGGVLAGAIRQVDVGLEDGEEIVALFTGNGLLGVPVGVSMDTCNILSNSAVTELCHASLAGIMVS